MIEDVPEIFSGTVDVPLTGDFNGDDVMDRAVFRNGEWIIDYNVDGTVNRRANYGMNVDTPLVW